MGFQIITNIFGLGSRASGLEDDIHRSPQGSLQHRGDELEEEHDIYFEPIS